jgi:acetyl esterase/lipase
MTPAFIPPTGTVVPVWPGTPPGSEMWTWTEQELLIDGDRMVRNVSVPTLEVFAPTGEPTGTAVIVAPGGAYQLLMVDHEGTDLARWLAARGVAAFVLRYRIAHTPEDDGEMIRFRRELDEHVRTTPWSAGRIAIIGKEAERAKALGDEDGRQAIRLLRARADEWGVDPARVGIAGFSAGAWVAMEAAASPDAGSRPNFAAPIYGARPDDLVVPDDAPPLFLALAIDDAMVPATESVSIWKAWHAAGRPAELHVFQTGGHGFGMKRLGLGSDAWIALLEIWMRGLGLLDPEARHAALVDGR